MHLDIFGTEAAVRLLELRDAVAQLLHIAQRAYLPLRLSPARRSGVSSGVSSVCTWLRNEPSSPALIECQQQD